MMGKSVEGGAGWKWAVTSEGCGGLSRLDEGRHAGAHHRVSAETLAVKMMRCDT
jgi:hypothetical protein